MYRNIVDGLIHDEKAVTAEMLKRRPHSRTLALPEMTSLLMSPDSGQPLELSADASSMTDGANRYPVVHGSPVLYPEFVSGAFSGSASGMELKYYDDSRLQYFLLSQIKQHGDVNAPSTDVHYERHLFRISEFVQDCGGLVLDVGCDDVTIGASLMPAQCRYIGIDPFLRNEQVRVVGVGEFLPFKSESVDHVLFNTSLDHVFDYHKALDEAFRVVQPGGTVIIASLVWWDVDRSTLLSDSVHFHHFRDYEIDGAARARGIIEKVADYAYKDSTHRYSRYMSVRKGR